MMTAPPPLACYQFFFCQVDSLLLKILSDSNGIYSFLMASYIDKYDHGNMVSQCPKGKVD